MTMLFCIAESEIKVIHTYNVWNKLSEECVHASSVNSVMFKNRIDQYLVKAGYTYNKGRLHL